MPGILVIGAGAVMVKQVKKYWKHNNKLPIMRGYYWLLTK